MLWINTCSAPDISPFWDYCVLYLIWIILFPVFTHVTTTLATAKTATTIITITTNEATSIPDGAKHNNVRSRSLLTRHCLSPSDICTQCLYGDNCLSLCYPLWNTCTGYFSIFHVNPARNGLADSDFTRWIPNSKWWFIQVCLRQ